MTVKEIAAAVGKDERSVQRWIGKITNDKMSPRNGVLNDKMSPRNGEAVSRQKFVRRVKELYPNLEYKQKKGRWKAGIGLFWLCPGG